jgi:hypothetical protein
MRACCGVVLVLMMAGAATAQDAPRARATVNVQPSDVDVLLATQAVLHTADMIATSYDLTIGSTAREANPLLGGFARRPVTLVMMSGAIDVLQAYTIAKLQHRHPKIALWWARTLVGVEVWTTINNIDAAGELQRRRAIGNR